MATRMDKHALSSTLGRAAWSAGAAAHAFDAGRRGTSKHSYGWRRRRLRADRLRDGVAR